MRALGVFVALLLGAACDGRPAEDTALSVATVSAVRLGTENDELLFEQVRGEGG